MGGLKTADSMPITADMSTGNYIAVLLVLLPILTLYIMRRRVRLGKRKPTF